VALRGLIRTFGSNYLARQPSGAWSTPESNFRHSCQAPRSALPGDYLGEGFDGHRKEVILMACYQAQTETAVPDSPPGLAVSYEGRNPSLLERVLPFVEYIEISPDTLVEPARGLPVFAEPAIAELKDVSSDVRLIVHGVDLSIGTRSGYSEAYLQLLEQFMEKVDIEWHSEHLGYVAVDGQDLGTMLPLPRTEEALDMICERVYQIQKRFGLPFLLENVVHLLPDCDADYTEAGFLNAITAATSCELLLDIYNLECDSHNRGFDIASFLSELNLERVRELHLAGGIVHKGFKLDVHSRITADSTIALAREVLGIARQVRTVTYELLPEAIPVLGADAVRGELERLSQALEK
jgi:uncharacterized protein